MPDLHFEVTGAETPPYSALPIIVFKLHVTNAPEQENIYTIALRCQIQIAATRRPYSPETKAKLKQVYGEPERWRDTVRAFLWTNTTVVVPGFAGSTTADMPVACTYDFDVVSTTYLDALDGGNVPLNFLFSGTTFYENDNGILQVAQISWGLEATYRMPVALWRTMIEQYYPNTAWIRLQKDVFEQLQSYKIARGLPTWEETFTRLLANPSEGERP